MLYDNSHSHSHHTHIDTSLTLREGRPLLLLSYYHHQICVITFYWYIEFLFMSPSDAFFLSFFFLARWEGRRFFLVGGIIIDIDNRHRRHWAGLIMIERTES